MQFNTLLFLKYKLLCIIKMKLLFLHNYEITKNIPAVE